MTRLHCSVLLLCVATIATGLTASVFKIQAQGLSTDSTISPTSPSSPSNPNSNQCSVIGSNFAVPFEYRPPESAMTEANFALLSVSSFANIDEYMTTIKTWTGATNPLGSPRRVIIRLGASKDDVGPSAAEYARILNHVAETYPVIAMVSHNEPNGQEATALCNAAGGPINICTADIDSPGLFEQKRTIVLNYERTYASTVLSLVPSSNVTFITGQLDNYFNSSGSVDNSRAIEFATTILRVSPRISGISLPVYITSGFPDAATAVALYDRTVQGIRAAIGRDFDVYVTESGPYLDQDDTFEKFLTALQTIVTRSNLKAFLLFNSHGFNPDQAFTYTRPFWNELCRKALRETCFDTETVLAACGSSGERTCRNFCRGDASDPCKLTPQNDCSMPFEVSDIVNRNVTDLRKQEVVKYLKEYLPQANIGPGVFHEHVVKIEGADACAPGKPQANTAYCTATGTNELNIGRPSSLNYIVPAEDPDSINTSRRFLESASNLDQPPGQAQDELDMGVNVKAMHLWERLYRIGDLANLKEECYLRGRVVESLPTAFFGNVRCMNYQVWNSCPSSSGCEFKDERKLFEGGPLQVCRDIGRSTGMERTSNYEACRKAFENLKAGDRINVESLPTVPKARRPLIYVQDFTPPMATQPNTWTTSPANDDYGDEFLNLVNPQPPTGDTAPEDGVPTEKRLFTQYQVAEEIVGDDTFHATWGFSLRKFTVNLLEIFRAKAAQPTVPVDFFEPLINGETLSDISRFITSDKPFAYRRLPEDVKADKRYLMIQSFTNQLYGRCVEQPGRNDGITYENELNFVGDSGFVGWQVLRTANISNLVQLVTQRGGSTDGFVLDQTINCLIHPKTVSDANELNYQTARIYTPLALQPLVEDNKTRDINQDLSLAGRASPTDQGLGLFGRANITNGVGDLECHWDPVLYPDKNPLQKPGLPKPPCVVNDQGEPYYCNENCPRVAVVTVENKTTNQFGRKSTTMDANVSFSNLVLCKFIQPLFAASKQDKYHQCVTRFSSEKPRSTATCSFEVQVASTAHSSYSQIVPQSSNLKALLSEAAGQYQIPIDTLLTVLFVENCRSNTMYNGQSASICTKSDQFFSSGNLLAPRVEYPHTNLCTLPGSGTDEQANTHGTNDAKGVFQFYHNIFADNACDLNFDGKCDTQDIELGAKTANWGYSRVGINDNVCSIHDSTYAAAKTLAEKINKPASSWTLSDKQAAVMYWAYGVADPSRCNAGEPIAEMYCDLIQDLHTPGGNLDLKNDCN